jgi:hypothetical protein
MQNVGSGFNQIGEDRLNILECLAIFNALFHRQTEGDGEIPAYCFADFLQYLNHKTTAVAETAPIFIVPFVGESR